MLKMHSSESVELENQWPSGFGRGDGGLDGEKKVAGGGGGMSYA